MAQFNFAQYEQQQAARQSNNGGKDLPKTHFMNEYLKSDGSQVIVRFPYKSMDDLVFESVHKIIGVFPNNLYGKMVRCTGKSDCPLCNHADENVRKKSMKFYAKMVVYNAVAGGVELCPTVWERPSMFADSDLKNLITEYGDLTNLLFKITRTGSGTNTRYTIMPVMNKTVYPDSIYVNDLSCLEGIDPVKILSKSMEQYEEALNPGSTNKDAAVKTESAPVTAAPKVEVVDDPDPFTKVTPVVESTPKVTPVTTNAGGATRYKF